MFYRKVRIGKYKFRKNVSYKLFLTEYDRFETICLSFVERESKILDDAEKLVDKAYYNLCKFNIMALATKEGIDKLFTIIYDEADYRRFEGRLRALAHHLEISIDPKVLDVIKGRAYMSLVRTIGVPIASMESIIDVNDLIWLLSHVKDGYQDELFELT